MKYLNTPYLIDDTGYYAVPDTWTEWDDQARVVVNGVIPEGFIYLDWLVANARRILAVRLLRDEWSLEAEVTNDNVTIGNKEFLVLPRVSIASCFRDVCEAYMNSVLRSAPPEVLKYVDLDKWASDKLRDGVSNLLAPFDHIENIVPLDTGYYHVYRIK